MTTHRDRQSSAICRLPGLGRFEDCRRPTLASHSDLSTVTGSTRAARYAGLKTAVPRTIDYHRVAVGGAGIAEAPEAAMFGREDTMAPAVVPPKCDGAQSCRRASIASVREARYAGAQLAASATAIIATATAANVVGSVSPTP